MSRRDMNAIITRSYEDNDFVEQFWTDPEVAIVGYDLDDEERAVLHSGHDEKMVAAAGRTHKALGITDYGEFTGDMAELDPGKMFDRYPGMAE